MTNDDIAEALDEISLYFYGCYRNAGGGTRACEKFHGWMVAVDEAKKIVEKEREHEADSDTLPR